MIEKSFSHHTFAELLELTRPILKSLDFHDIVRDLDALSPKTKEVLLELCNAYGERVLSFNEVARRRHRSPGLVRQTFMNGQLRIRLALFAIARYLEGESAGAWTTLPTEYVKLVNPEHYAKQMTRIGKVRQQWETVRVQIDELGEMQHDLRKRKKELQAAAERLEIELDQHGIPVRHC